MAQDPVALDDNGNPIYTELDDNGNPVVGGNVSAPLPVRAFEAANQPLATFPQDPISQGARENMTQQYPWAGKAAEFGLGILEGNTAPMNLALGATLGGGKLATGMGYGNVGRQLIKTGKFLSYPGLAHGGYNMFTGDTGLEKGLGALEAGLSIGGIRMKVPPKIEFNPNIAANIVKEGDEWIDAVTGEVVDAPPTVKPPMFNPKKQTGLTGNLQTQAALNVGKVRIKETTPDVIKALLRRGYVPGGVDPDRIPYMVKGDKPLEPPPLKIQVKDPKTGKIKGFRGTEAEAKAKGWEIVGPSRRRELWNAPRAAMSVDLPFITSAAFRQGLPLVGTKHWLQAWNKARVAYGDVNAFEGMQARIESMPLFKDGVDVDFRGGRWVTKRVPSFAQKMGVRMTDLRSYRDTEENVSHWLEKIPGYGKHIAGSNRAYTAFLNHLRAETFTAMVNGSGAQNNIPMAMKIAEFVNDATGRGTMRIGDISLEQSSKILADTMFSPRNFFSRTNMITQNVSNLGHLWGKNVATGKYALMPDKVRREYVKAGLRVAATWGGFSTLMSVAGADVGMDPTSSDFGKVKIGNTRLDPAGGFQQFLVLAARLAANETTSSTSGNTRTLGEGYRPPSWGSTVQDFASWKAHPMFKLFYDAFYANERVPVHVADRAAQMVFPMFISDIMEVVKDDPLLLPLVLPLVNVGMGSQTYTDEYTKPTFEFPVDLRMESMHPSQWSLEDANRRGRSRR